MILCHILAARYEVHSFGSFGKKMMFLSRAICLTKGFCKVLLCVGSPPWIVLLVDLNDNTRLLEHIIRATDSAGFRHSCLSLLIKLPNLPYMLSFGSKIVAFVTVPNRELNWFDRLYKAGEPSFSKKRHYAGLGNWPLRGSALSHISWLSVRLHFPRALVRCALSEMSKCGQVIGGPRENNIGAFLASTWASYQIRKILSCPCAGNTGNVFPVTDFKWNRHLAILTCMYPQFGDIKCWK